MKKVGKMILSIFKWSLLTIISLLSIGLIMFGNIILPSSSKMGNNFLGYDKGWDNSKVDTSGLDLQYTVSDYTKDDIPKATKELSTEIAQEGVVLLKNDKESLPLAKDTEISFFGVNSRRGQSNASGVVALLGTFLGSGSTDLKSNFEQAGFSVNDTLWNYYQENGDGYGLSEGSISYGDAENFAINELPLEKLEKASVLDSAKGTHPVFVLKRVAGEGRDMPRSMYQHADNEDDKSKSYLEPDSVELEILDYLNKNFEDITLLVQTNAAVELDWVDDFENINSILYAPTVDASLGQIVSGDVNPSGRTVDTFASDPLASPAAQNTGSYLYYDEKGKPTIYNYISYLEGIYVGYKYYETRYEDVVLKQGNAGEYNYDDEVVYPFGYGLSYTDFEWTDYKVVQDGANIAATVTVTNTGDRAGKEVVQLYAQSPYTDYDKENHIEKAAVNLVGYAKTEELAPGKSQKVTITFNQEQLKAYDAQTAKTYIMDAGDYYVTVAKDAHEASTNILEIKAPTVVNGNADRVYHYTVDKLDTTTYATDSYSGEKITNQFDAAKGDLTYLSRSDWTGTFPQHDGKPSDQISTWGE